MRRVGDTFATRQLWSMRANCEGKIVSKPNDATSLNESGGIIIMNTYVTKAFALVCGTAVAALIAGAMLVTVSQTAKATPAFAAATGKPCGQCHQNPAGGGALKPFGEKFKANGFK